MLSPRAVTLGFLVALTAATLTLIVGCGDSGSPARPTPTPATVSSLTLTPATDLLKIGATETFTAQATMSDGTTQTVVPAWSSSNTTVATVDSGGRVSALGPGQVTIVAEYQGRRAERALRVVPDYQGSWAGTYKMVNCTETGAFRTEHICDELDVVGSIAPVQLRLAQDRDRITGTLAFGTLLGDVTGEIGTSGALALEGRVTYEESGQRGIVALDDWDTMASGAEMTGKWVEVWTMDGVSGEMRIGCDVQALTRTSSTALPRAAGTGRPVLHRGATLGERVRGVLRAIR